MPSRSETLAKFARSRAAFKLRPDKADKEDEAAATARSKDAYDRSVGAGKQTQGSKKSDAKSSQTGARGGTFYINAAGNKVYLKK